MPLPKLDRTHFLFEATKPLNLCDLIRLVSLKHRRGSPFSTPFCTKTFSFNYQNSLSSGDSRLVDELLFILTKRPFYPDSQELRDFGPKLTTEVVETVLRNVKSWKIAYTFFNWASNQYGYRHSCYSFNAMASILSHARQNGPLRILAAELVNSQCWMTPGALGFFLRCLSRQGMVEEANFLFDQVKKKGLCCPNTYSYNCLLEAISKTSSVDLMEMRLKEMRDLGWEFDKFTLTPVLLCYCNARKFEKALDVFNQMYERSWVDGHVLSILALAFSKWGEVDKAFELIEQMQGLNINLNEKTFYVLIHGFVKECRVEKALLLLDRMHELGFFPDISLYDVLIEGLCKNKEFKKALQLYLRMREVGIHPDVKILTTLVSTLPGEKEMIQLLEGGLQDVGKDDMILLYNSVLRSLVSNGSIDKAYCLLQTMMADGSRGVSEIGKLSMVRQFVLPDTHSFEIVIDGLCRTDKLDLALCLFRNMEQSGCKYSVLLYNNLIDCLSNSNRLEECFELLSEMKQYGLKPTHFTHNSIFGCLCRREDVGGAIHIVKEMRSYGHEPWIKNSALLVKKLCKHGRAVEACKFLADMVQEGFLLDIVPYSAAIDGLFEIGEVDQALKLFREICGRGYCPDVVAYNIIINGLCKAKQVLEAQEILNEMLAKGLVPSVVTYNSLIDGWCKNGDIDNAIICLSKMIEEKQDANIITYTTIISGLCNAGRPNDAINLWKEMEGKGCLPNKIAYMAFIQGLCKCGKSNDALVFLQQMEEKEMTPDGYVYVAMIDAFISNSNPALGFDILKKMLHTGNFPTSVGKNYLILKDAISTLSQDSRTSSNVSSLIADGSIPSIYGSSEVGSDSGCRETP